MFRLREVMVHIILEQHKYKHLIFAAYLTFLAPLGLLHHKIQVVKHQCIKADTWCSQQLMSLGKESQAMMGVQ
jgi:hypothetical protein